MLFRRQTLEGIAHGEVTLAFRRWKRPTVKAGGSVRTAAGVVLLGRVDVVDATDLEEADAKASGFMSLAALQDMLGPEDGNTVYRIELHGIEPDERVDLRKNAKPNEDEWTAIRAKFDRWEKTKPRYFPAVLKLIRNRPGSAAGLLAEELAVEKLAFKADVRKLKELGLTESLDVGYRLSPRGEVVLKWLEERL